LRATVATLRDELEKARLEKDIAVRNAIAAAESENIQLRATAASLREGLELAQIDKDNAVRREQTLHAGEIAQFHETVRALREQLEARTCASTSETVAGTRSEH